MLQQLLWSEVILKGVAGIVLALLPGYASAITGLPNSTGGFWPRMVGALLLGIAGALLLQGTFPNIRTITPAGLIALNLAGAGMLVTLLVLGKASLTRRGRIALWALTAALALLSLIEIAYA